MSWPTVPLGELVRKCETWDPKADSKGEFVYIDLSSVDKDTKTINNATEVACAEAPSRARQLVQTNDVLVATVRPNLNGVALVEANLDGSTASTGYCVLRPDTSKLDPRYLFHWVKTDRFVEKMVDVATGANYPAVSDSKVKASKIPLPHLTEQKRIAGILDAADALRAKRRESIEQLDRLIQSTFLEMFGDPVTNPKGWPVHPLGVLAEFRNGDRGENYPSKTDFVENGVPFINAGHLQDGAISFAEMNYITRRRFDKLGGGKTKLGDMLYCLRGSLGKSAVVRHEHDSAIASSLVILRPFETLNVDYLHTLLAGHYGRIEVEKYDTGSSQPNLSAASVKKYTIPTPPSDLQSRFGEVLCTLRQHSVTLERHLDSLDVLFTSLQARAFAGEL